MAITKRFIPCAFRTASQPEVRTVKIRRDISIAPHNENAVILYKKSGMAGPRKRDKDKFVVPKQDLQLFPGGLDAGIKNPHMVCFACLLVQECQKDLQSQIDVEMKKSLDLEVKIEKKDTEIKTLKDEIEKLKLESRKILTSK